MSKQVNRSLEDRAMDQIDHALGRPVDPLVESYRNYFATEADSKHAIAFAASPYWDTHGRTAPGQMTYFFVTQDGRQALKDHLKQIGEKHRLFDVTYQGQTQAVVAETSAKAKYSLWLSISDCRADLSFKKFCQSVSVRVAA